VKVGNIEFSLSGEDKLFQSEVDGSVPNLNGPYQVALPWRQEPRYQTTVRWRKSACCIINVSPQTYWSTSTVVCSSAVKLGIILHIWMETLSHGF